MGASPGFCFNPRPALARGATGKDGPAGPGFEVSIRAPRSRAGRPDMIEQLKGYFGVSIRAPRSRAGRRGGRGRACGAWVFQSAPRARARGDGNAAPAAAQQVEFQSAPRARARGDARAAPAPTPSRCFNPRPALARGATDAQAGDPGAELVSIRAPRSRAGRPLADEAHRLACLFQSAPRARARGDPPASPTA